MPNEENSRKRSWLLGTITVLISISVTLLVLEIVLHVLDIPREQISHQRLFVEYDPVRGWRNRANESGRIATDEYAQDLSYNERGMRGPVRPYEKPAGVYRIVLVGDSFVDGYTEDLGNRVGDVLERLLNETTSAGSVEVISLGVGGYSTDQELLWLESEGMRYQPDLVILLFYANDIWYNGRDSYWRGGKPMFTLAGDSIELTNVPVPPPDPEPTQTGSLAARVNGWVRASSKLYWLLARAVQNQPRLYGIAVRLGLTEPSPEMVFDAGEGTVIPGEFSVFRRQLGPEAEQAWNVTDALVRRMRDVARAGGSEFLAALVPMRSRIYTQSDDVRANAGDEGEIDAAAVARRFGQLCAADSIACLDPTDAFVTAAESLRARGERLYYRYDWHWNSAGHALGGRILSDAVMALRGGR